MTLEKPLGLPLSEPQGLPQGSPLGLGVPYSLLLSPNSQLPSPSWLPVLYLTRAPRLDKQEFPRG